MSTNVSSVTKHFPAAQNGFTTTLGSTAASGATTVVLQSIGSYTNGETVVLVVDPLSATGKQVFTGVVDVAGVQITGVVWTAGTNQSHAAGVTVVDYFTATHISMMTKGLLVAHDQDGTHKSGATYLLPTIASFANANHSHANSAGGGQLGFSALLSTIFSGQVSSQANTGTAGGTMYYINLGGIKLLWGKTGTLSVSGASPGSNGYTILFPASFFNTIQANVGIISEAAVNTTSLYWGPNTSTPDVNGWVFTILQSAGSNGSAKGSFLVIGT